MVRYALEGSMRRGFVLMIEDKRRLPLIDGVTGKPVVFTGEDYNLATMGSPRSSLLHVMSFMVEQDNV